MKDFLFFYTHAEFHVREKMHISEEDVEKLKQKGFKIKEVKALDKRDAIIQMTGEENTKSLKEYTGNTTLSALIESLLR
ncbi:hypothetical protein [Pantoea sp.]|uniref:hypothetical protein n=1 Tax=Pantoea sp. TaxID=69393 RepID=UPI0028AF4EF9|nr:hypothetical protein [Pantoea sp.]